MSGIRITCIPVATAAQTMASFPHIEPITPVPLATHANSPALPADATYLHSLFRRFLQRLPVKDRGCLVKWLQWRFRGRIVVSTCCSGTDCPLLAWVAFSDVLRDDLGCHLQVVHGFSSEISEGKQRFLKDVYPELPMLFEDTRSLGQAAARDCVTGRDLPVPLCDSFAGGFPCTTASSLNPRSSSVENRTSVLNGDLATGSVFRGVAEYVANAAKRLSFVLLENVCALAFKPQIDGVPRGPSNLDAVVGLLSQVAGCFTVVFRLSPQLFGVPQMRQRLWFASAPREELQRCNISEGDFSDKLADVMGNIVGAAPQSMAPFLLPESHEYVQKYYESLQSRSCVLAGDPTGALLACRGRVVPAGAAAKRAKMVDTTSKWIGRHIEEAERRGLHWGSLGILDQDLLALFPGLRRFTLREIEIMQLAGVQSFPETACRTVEVHQAMGRQRLCEDSVACLTPKNVYYLTTRCRELLGLEKFRLQSIWFPPSTARSVEKYDHAFLSDLAGNAFEGSCVAAMLFCSCVALAQRAGDSPFPRSGVGDRLDDSTSDDSEPELCRKALAQWLASIAVVLGGSQTSSCLPGRGGAVRLPWVPMLTTQRPTVHAMISLQRACSS
jgi:site-specific DNA-cytosine methylase